MVDLKSGLEIEVLSAADAARRRPWSETDKLRIVEASFAGRRLVSATARRHGI
jgi:transposase